MFYYSNKLSIKVLVLLLLLLTPWMNIAAAPLTPEQALNRIKSSSSAKRVFGKTPYVLAYTEKFDNNDYLFVFNRNNDGFIIASADDRMPALLGYSDNGAFNEADAAPALKWWLSQYAEQAWEGLKSENTSYNNSISTRSGKSTVDPLLKTQWNQVSPFNLDCPQDANGQCVTGCVATAMAQVIKYYGHPSIGKGSYSYNWNETTLSFNYGSATFDYQNMLNEYNNEATDVEKAAVAQLMYACGVGVNMNYTSNESGASDAYVPYALTEYFDYDKSIQYLLRDYYPDSEWEEIIYNEVNSGRPVIYGGQAENGGHEFVCDGYDGEGKFHINWGWGGLGDGYFLLSALNPSDQGTGSYEGGYNSSQTAVCGIKPNSGSIQTTYPIYATGSLSLNERINNDIVKIGIINGGIYNYSPAETNAKLWLKAVSSTGKEYISNSGTDLKFPGCQGIHLSGFSAISLYLPSAKDGEKLEEGEYKLYLVYQNAQGAVLPVPIPNGCTDYIDMYVDKDGNISFIKADPDEQASIIVTELYPLTSVITGVETTFHISYQNNSNVHYSGKLYIKTFKKDSETALYNLSFSISLAAGLSQGGTFQMTYNNLPAGEYYLKCFDDKNEPCSDVFKISITNPIIEAEGITLDTTEKTMTEGDSFILKATIDPETTSDKTVKWSSSDTKVATVEDGNVTAVAPGTAIITAETSNGLQATCSVTVIAKIITVSSITLSTTDWSGIEGDCFILTANVAPENATDNTVTWTSSNDKVATVDANGIVNAVGVGKAIITVSCGNVSAQCAISCYPIIGDANWDGTIAINDAVDIANFVVKKKVAPDDWAEDEWIIFYTVGANANQSEDGRISFADASATVNLALAQEVSTTSQNRINTYRGFHEAADALVIGSVTYNNQGHLFAPITLDNSMNYVALQADITGPEGTSIDIKEGSRIAMSHSLMTRRIKDNMIRVAIFNLGNLSFAENNEPIIEVITDSSGLDSENITISNIIASDADANGYVLVSRLGNTTGMIGVSNDKVIIAKIPNGIQINNIIGKKVLIYTLDGKIINSFEASQDSEIINLSSGVYVVKVGDQTLKIVL